MTFTEMNIEDPQAQDRAEMQALLDSLKGVALPAEMTFTLDPGATSGSAVMTVDFSSLGGGAGSSDNERYPLTFTYSGNELTFAWPPSEGLTRMTGAASRQGQNLVMSGVISVTSQGFFGTATWQVTKRIAL
jgi:hypothetical protein